jgi:hypothetical protein
LSKEYRNIRSLAKEYANVFPAPQRSARKAEHYARAWRQVEPFEEMGFITSAHRRPQFEHLVPFLENVRDIRKADRLDSPRDGKGVAINGGILADKMHGVASSTL